MGVSWTYIGDQVDINGHVFTQLRSVHSVDANGTLVLPIGSYPCIRQKRVDYTTTKVIVSGQVYSESVTKSVWYTFISKEGVNATLVVDSIFENSSYPFIQSLTYSVANTSTWIEQPAQPQDIGDIDVYPNPVAAGVNPVISWMSANTDQISIQLYNSCGMKQSELYEGLVGQGMQSIELPLTGLTPGVYFIRVLTGTRSRVHAVTITR
jgi:hypothetical protein